MVTHKQRAEDSPKIVFSFIMFSNAAPRTGRARQSNGIINGNPASQSRPAYTWEERTAGGARPGERFLSAGMKTEKSARGTISIHVTGKAVGTWHGGVSILPCAVTAMFPCAMATTAQSSSFGIVPPCNQACSGVQISVVAMNSQIASDKIPAARKIRSRARLLNWRFLYCKSFAL